MLGGVKGKIGFFHVNFFVGLVKVLGVPKGDLGCYFSLVGIIDPLKCPYVRVVKGIHDKRTPFSIPKPCHA